MSSYCDVMTEDGPAPRQRIAVVGAGVAGLTAAYVLSRTHEVTLYEAEPRLGGHAHTHTLDTSYGEIRVDSGFIVHNDRTYPLLRRLFGELGVESRPTEMSMSIRDDESGIEYAGGRGIRGFVGRPRQFLDRRFTSMLSDVRRFHRLATAFLSDDSNDADVTYGEFLDSGAFPRAFVELYAVPLVACVWSSDRGGALGYPARFLFQFLANHGMLAVTGSPTWATVEGGSARYVEAIGARLQHVVTSADVTAVRRDDSGVTVIARGGRAERHDRVVLATHADTSLALLVDATPLEKEVLGAFRYSRNPTLLHTDGRLMPRTRPARASWNYRILSGRPDQAVVTYWMNRLQGIDARFPLYVSLHAEDLVDPKSVLAEMTYDHPIIDVAAVRARSRLPELNDGRTAFAGAYHGWGFHEDGCAAGVAAAASMGVTW